VLTPSIHGDFITYVSLLRSYGVWTRFPSTFVVDMFSNEARCLRGTKKIKDVEVQGGFLQDLHNVMYMSINHGETIDDFQEHGRVVVGESFTNIGLVMRGQITSRLITVNLVSDNIYHGLVFKVIL